MAAELAETPSPRDPIAVICQAAIEQAVMAAESPPLSLDTAAAYTAVSQEMLRQAVLAALEAGLAPETLARLASEAIVAASRARGSA
jgi:hypothetical protein